MYGGAIYMVGDGNITTQASTFSENTATRKGGALCADSFNSIII